MTQIYYTIIILLLCAATTTQQSKEAGIRTLVALDDQGGESA